MDESPRIAPGLTQSAWTYTTAVHTIDEEIGTRVDVYTTVIKTNASHPAVDANKCITAGKHMQHS